MQHDCHVHAHRYNKMLNLMNQCMKPAKRKPRKVERPMPTTAELTGQRYAAAIAAFNATCNK